MHHSKRWVFFLLKKLTNRIFNSLLLSTSISKQ
uniref:Uncharacterized protein n=1 Tax=Arundo donax TaxID=35708 RepID=A0A0A9HLT4_ARUDO